jgi:hypothetical protein
MYLDPGGPGEEPAEGYSGRRLQDRLELLAFDARARWGAADAPGGALGGDRRGHWGSLPPALAEASRAERSPAPARRSLPSPYLRPRRDLPCKREERAVRHAGGAAALQVAQ